MQIILCPIRTQAPFRFEVLSEIPAFPLHPDFHLALSHNLFMNPNTPSLLLQAQLPLSLTLKSIDRSR